MTEYPSNSHKSREMAKAEPPRERKVEKVVSGGVSTKTNNGRKFLDTFISEDSSKVKSYIFMDVLVPAVKKLVYDIVTDAVDIILYGGNGGGGRARSSSGASKISYRSFYDSGRDNRREVSSPSVGRFDYEDIEFKSRADAENVLRNMQDILEDYKMVRVADMYDLAGLEHPYTSNDYAWTSLRTAEVIRTRGGWVIKMPKASPID